MPLFRRQPPEPQSTAHLVLEGAKRLEVVGESFYTENYDRIATHYRVEDVSETGLPVLAVLEAEPDNPYDPNAVAVKVAGLNVGHLDRDTAARYQPAVVRLTAQYGMPIALRGFINRGRGPDGKYWLTLDHDPADFT